MPPVIRAGRVPGGVPKFKAQTAQPIPPPVTGAVGGSGGVVDGNTVLLVHADGTNGSTSFTDSSSYAHTLTAAGSAQVTTSSPKFGTGSIALGSGVGSVGTGNATDFHFGAGQFTIEAWAYFTAAPDANYRVIIAQWDDSPSPLESWWFGLDNGSNLIFSWSTDGSYSAPNVVSAAITPTLNTWYHLAVDRDATGTLRLYRDGVVLNSASVSAAFYATTAICQIGDDGSGTSGSFPGNLDEVRISKGLARYGGAFTPPTAPFGGALAQADQTLSAAGTVLTPITGGVGAGTPPDSYTSLLMHADGTAGSTSFIDSSLYAHTLTSSGVTVNATAKFGSGSADFTASHTSYIDTGNKTDFLFGNGPFTVEAWCYLTSSPNLSAYNCVIASLWGTDVSQDSWWFGWIDNGAPGLLHSDGGNYGNVTSSYTTPVLNTWTHIAVDRDAGQFVRIYVNGVVVGGPTFLGASFGTAPQYNCLIGDEGLSSTSNFLGYLDEVRISKGLARYGGAFTPPTAPFGGSGALAQADQTLSAAGTVGAAAGVTGTLNVTEASDSLAAIGTVLVGGTFSSTQASHTLAALGTVQVAATLAATQASHTLAALGSVGFPVLTGSVTATQASHTLAAAGLGAAFGPLVASQASQTLAALGGPRVGATLSSTQASHTLAAAGNVIAGATLNVTQASHTLAATGWSAAFGPVAATQTAHTLVALGADALGGTLVVTQASHTLAALGSPRISGTLGVTQASHTLAAAGSAIATGTLAATQASHTLAATGWRAASGALIDTQDAHTLAGSGSVVTGTSGSLLLPQAPHSLVAAGTVATGGTLAVSQASHTLAAVGRSTISGTLTATQTSQTLAAVGNGAAMGTLAAPQASHTLAATGRATVAGVLAAIQDSQIIAATGRSTVVGGLVITQANQTLNGYGLFGATEQARVLVMA